jgi:2-polyprenyl-3-methyl-5-hydroxy-6-metoxy-1,4-benzoquinol methylase
MERSTVYTATMLLKRPCPICDFSDNKKLFSQEFAYIEGISFLKGYDVVSCKMCGFVYADNIPDQSVFDSFYINANKYELEIEQPDSMTGVYDYLIDELVHLGINKAARIVDVGCARSEILRSLQNIGYTNLTGIDTSIKNVEYLVSKGISGIHSTVGAMDALIQYDVVFSTGVLEHIVDLHQAVGALNKITAVNGVIVVCVPDMAALMSGELPYQEFSREHINYFTELSLSSLMLRHGFNLMFMKKGRSFLTGFFRKHPGKFRRDDSGERHIENYIASSKKYEEEIYANLRQYSDVPTIIWGLGTFGQRLMANNVLGNIVALVDSDPRFAGKKFGDICTILPSELVRFKEPILLAVSTRYIDAIEQTIKCDLKLENEIIKLHADYMFDYT